MDIYRFFHPHHNPRLRRTRIRYQELCELEHAASELTRALAVAKERCARKPVANIAGEQFVELLKAGRFLEQSLHALRDAHPGDAPDEQDAIASERSSLVGWEGWTKAFRAIEK
jgi:hypothetical protein